MNYQVLGGFYREREPKKESSVWKRSYEDEVDEYYADLMVVMKIVLAAWKSGQVPTHEAVLGNFLLVIKLRGVFLGCGSVGFS